MFYQTRSAEAANLERELGCKNPAVFAIQCDVSDLSMFQQAMAEAVARLGRLDILIYNAGPLADYEDDAFDRTFAVNVRAPFYAARMAARVMEDNGRIILIGRSLADNIPGPRATLYAASKAALAGLVRGLARDFGERGITVNLVQTGPIATERNASRGDRGNVAAGPLVLKRYGATDEVAGMVAYLISDEGAYRTGGTYSVDGGWTA